MSTLKIKNLSVSIEEKTILKSLSLTINSNEIHALIGPNGQGKSTLFMAIMGHPKYKITSGNIYLDGIDITNLPIEERAKLGLFLGFQSPVEVPGVVISDFLKMALNNKSDTHIPLGKFIKESETAAKSVDLNINMLSRMLNEGFSGGEKKRNEILQMLLLKPKFAMLDEIDSGLDIDAINSIGELIKRERSDSFGAILVSHYQKLYDIIEPTHFHLLIDGSIVESGDRSLLDEIISSGYEKYKKA